MNLGTRRRDCRTSHLDTKWVPFVAFYWVCVLWCRNEWGETDHFQGVSYSWRSCLPPCAYLWCAGWLWSSSPCSSSVRWGLLGLCMRSDCTMSGIFHNFAKMGQFVQVVASPHLFSIFIFIKLDKKNNHLLQVFWTKLFKSIMQDLCVYYICWRTGNYSDP